MAQEVSILPLNPSLRNKLLTSGYHTVSDLHGVGAVQLADGTDGRPGGGVGFLGAV